MTFEIVPASELTLAEQAEILNQAFAEYLVGWTEMDAAALARFLCAQGADLCYSRFARAQGRLVSFGYINRTGNVPRLSGMGTVPAARRTGAAGYLLENLLQEAKTRQDQAMVLEVFEQNPGAHALYRRHEFRDVTRLFGWRREPRPAKADGGEIEIEEHSILNVVRQSNAFEYPEIPWQISRHAMPKLAISHAFGDNRSSVVIGDTNTSPVRVHGFLARSEDFSHLRDTLAAVMAKFPKQEFFAPAIFPEQFGTDIFLPLGFKPEPLNQILMRHDL